MKEICESFASETEFKKAATKLAMLPFRAYVEENLQGQRRHHLHELVRPQSLPPSMVTWYVPGRRISYGFDEWTSFPSREMAEDRYRYLSVGFLPRQSTKGQRRGYRVSSESLPSLELWPTRPREMATTQPCFERCGLVPRRSLNFDRD